MADRRRGSPGRRAYAKQAELAAVAEQWLRRSLSEGGDRALRRRRVIGAITEPLLRSLDELYTDDLIDVSEEHNSVHVQLLVCAVMLAALREVLASGNPMLDDPDLLVDQLVEAIRGF